VLNRARIFVKGQLVNGYLSKFVKGKLKAQVSFSKTHLRARSLSQRFSLHAGTIRINAGHQRTEPVLAVLGSEEGEDRTPIVSRLTVVQHVQPEVVAKLVPVHGKGQVLIESACPQS
jgi:hypothetical protein